MKPRNKYFERFIIVCTIIGFMAFVAYCIWIVKNVCHG